MNTRYLLWSRIAGYAGGETKTLEWFFDVREAYHFEDRDEAEETRSLVSLPDLLHVVPAPSWKEYGVLDGFEGREDLTATLPDDTAADEYEAGYLEGLLVRLGQAA